MLFDPRGSTTGSGGLRGSTPLSRLLSAGALNSGDRSEDDCRIGASTPLFCSRSEEDRAAAGLGVFLRPPKGVVRRSGS